MLFDPNSSKTYKAGEHWLYYGIWLDIVSHFFSGYGDVLKELTEENNGIRQMGA